MENSPIENPDTSDAGTRLLSGTHQIVSNANRYFVVSATLGVFLLIVWAGFTQIDIVTRGSGNVEPSLQNQIVQHLEGGIIEEILVAEGQTVEAGDILMRIKDPFSEAEYVKASKELTSKRIELQRLNAEAQGLSKVTFENFLQRSAPEIVLDEEQLFEHRRDSLAEQMLILSDQYKRKKLEKLEKESRYSNTKQEYEIMAERVRNLERLHKAGAASKNEMLQNRSTLQQIQTKLTDLSHQIPQIQFELSEINRRQTDLNLSFRSDAETRRIETLRKIEQLQSSLSAMKDRNTRTDVRAPIKGKVHRLFQTTLGGVVRGGQNLVQLVPLDAPIAISMRLSPKDRGKVWINLPAVVKISAYDYSIYGGLNAKIIDISTDVLREDGEEPYFRVKLEASSDTFVDKHPIVAGMSAEVDIITGKRTILDYLLKPIQQVQSKALREG